MKTSVDPVRRRRFTEYRRRRRSLNPLNSAIELLTITRVAKLMGLNRGDVSRWFRNGELRTIQPPGHASPVYDHSVGKSVFGESC